MLWYHYYVVVVMMLYISDAEKGAAYPTRTRTAHPSSKSDQNHHFKRSRAMSTNSWHADGGWGWRARNVQYATTCTVISAHNADWISWWGRNFVGCCGKGVHHLLLWSRQVQGCLAPGCFSACQRICWRIIWYLLMVWMCVRACAAEFIAICRKKN